MRTKKQPVSVSTGICYDKARDVALRALTYRPRSEGEIRRKLQEKGFDGETIVAVVARLKEVRLLDDRSFAQLWVSERSRKGYGPLRLEKELVAKGVGRRLVESVIQEEAPLELQLRVAVRVAEKRVRRHDALDQAELSRKLGQFLYRRGYPWEVINRVLWEVLDGHPLA